MTAQLAITIEFHACRSSQMAAAIVVARELGCRDDNGQAYRVHVDVDVIQTDLRPIARLWKIIGKWTPTRADIAGPGTDRLTVPELLKRLDEIRQCYARRIPGKLASMHCSHKPSLTGDAACFGCRLLEGLQRLPGHCYDPLAWWNFGTLSDDLSSFTVDKPAVLEYLRHRGSAQVCTLCPAFSWAAVEAEVHSLPDRVELDEDSPFRIEYSKLDPTRPTGIACRQTAHSYIGDK